MRTFLISTLPKSSTWYHAIFFYHLQYLTKNFEPQVGGGINSIDDLLLKKKTPHIFNLSSCSLIDELWIGHMFCPGYEQLNDSKKKNWMKLKDWSGHGYNWVTDAIIEHNKKGHSKKKNR